MKLHVMIVGLAIAFPVAVAIQRVFPVAAQEGDQAARRTSTEELGRFLCWDPILSGEGDTACATCHHPGFAYADGRALSLGTGSVGLGPRRTDITGGAIPVVKRNSPTILNVGFNGLDDNRRRQRGSHASRVAWLRKPLKAQHPASGCIRVLLVFTTSIPRPIGATSDTRFSLTGSLV